MIRIKKASGGFRVEVTGKNDEPLSISEVLETKRACYKNILAQAKQYLKDTGCVIFYDVSDPKRKIKLVWRMAYTQAQRKTEKKIVVYHRQTPALFDYQSGKEIAGK